MIRSPHASNNWMQVQQQTQKPTNYIQGGGGGGAGQPGIIDQALQAGAGALMSSVLPGPLAGVGTSLVSGLFNEGGQVDPAAQGGAPDMAQLLSQAPPEVQQAVQAFMSGQIGPEELVQVLVQAGIPQETAMQLVQQVMAQSQGAGAQGLNAGGFAKDPDGNTLPSGMVWDKDLGKAITFGEKSRRLQVQHAQRAAQRRNTVGTEGYSTNAKNYERMRANPGQAPVKVGGRNSGGMIGHNPDTFINGQIASVHYPTPGPAQNAPVGPLTGMYNMGGTVNMSSPGYYTRNNGGKVPLSSTQPHGPMHLNDGGNVMMVMEESSAPVKKVRKKTTRGDSSDEFDVEFDNAVPPMSQMALNGLGIS